MKKKIILIACLPLTALAFAQVGINNTSPKATLDITAKTTDGSTPEGIIAPRLTGDQIKAADTQYGASHIGTLVYATAAVTSSTPKTVNIIGPGYYYFDGSFWQKILNSTAVPAYTSNNGLTISGNNIKLGGAISEPTTISGVTTTNKLAVTATGVDAVNIASNTLSVDAANSRIGIGTTAPSAKLEVNNGSTAGALKIVDGTQGFGKVLSSDANGLASWVTNVAVTPTVLGSIFSLADKNIESNIYLDRSIDLPPGKWIVSIGQMTVGANLLSPNQALWIKLTLSSSTTSNTLLPGVSFIGASLVGVAVIPSQANFFMGSGTVLINNATGVTQTLYLRTGQVDNYGGASANFYLQAGENYLYAHPIN